MGFRGFDSSTIKGWNSKAHREFPRKFESSNVSADNLSRGIGRSGGVSTSHEIILVIVTILLSVIIVIVIYVMIVIHSNDTTTTTTNIYRGCPNLTYISLSSHRQHMYFGGVL